MREKSVITGGIFASIALAILLLMNLPYQYVELNSVWMGDLTLQPSRCPSSSDMPTMAGWPLRYLIAYRSSDADTTGTSVVHFYSAFSAVVNCVLSLLMAACIFCSVRFRERRIQSAANPILVRRVFDTLFAFAIITVPTAGVASFYVRYQNSMASVGRLLQKNEVRTSTWVPRIISEHFPSRAIDMLASVRQVRGVQWDDADIQELAKLPALVDLEASTSSFDLQKLELFSEHKHLSGLKISRRQLEESDVDAIAKLPHLRRLSLSASRLSDSAFDRLNHQPHLTHLDLKGTSIPLSEIQQPLWSESIEGLFLSRPSDGLGDELHIESWPNLQALWVTRSTENSNNGLLAIELSDLPSLEQFVIDRIQNHSLRLKDVPNLKAIDDGTSALLLFDEIEQWTPRDFWVTRCEVVGAKSLKELRLYAPEMSSLELRDNPGLELISIGSLVSTPLGRMRQRRMDPAFCQQWVKAISESGQPPKVVFECLPLGSVDLSSLSQHKNLRSLKFERCGLSIDQIFAINELPSLRSLSLMDCSLNSDAIEKLKTQFPNLTSLSGDGTELTSLHLVGDHPLQTLSLSRLERAESLKVIDQVDLVTSFRVGSSPKTVEIQNAPGVFGLAFEQPWDGQAILGGLRDIRWFSAGGRNLGDEVFNQLLNCPDLDRLTLAYPGLSRESLVRIGEFNGLTSLLVPGTDLDDSITENWSQLERLWEINFDDTEVGAKTIRWLVGMESLRSVSLARVPMDDECLNAVSRLSEISYLNLSGVKLSVEPLRKLLRNDSLIRLDLSTCHLSDELIDEICQCSSMTLLRVDQCGLTDKQLSKLRERMTGCNIVIDPEELEHPPTRRISFFEVENGDLADESGGGRLTSVANPRSANEESSKSTKLLDQDGGSKQRIEGQLAAAIRRSEADRKWIARRQARIREHGIPNMGEGGQLDLRPFRRQSVTPVAESSRSPHDK